MSYQLEVRVPISPTPDFFLRIHFMAASLRRLEATIGAALLVICVGGDEEPRDLYEAQPWSKNYPLVWHWTNREQFRRESYWATSHDIFRQPTRARFVMCADADVIFVRDFSELLTELTAVPAVAGVIAHAPPLPRNEAAEMWLRVCQAYGIAPPVFEYEHTGWDFMTREKNAPPYFNFGMVLSPASLMEVISREMEAADGFVNATLPTFFRFQIALTLTILKCSLPARALPLRYNFPNDPRFDVRYEEEIREVRILHYLRYAIVHREEDFRTLDTVEALTARQDLAGSNEILRQTIAELYPYVRQEQLAAS